MILVFRTTNRTGYRPLSCITIPTLTEFATLSKARPTSSFCKGTQIYQLEPEPEPELEPLELQHLHRTRTLNRPDQELESRALI